MPFAHDFSTNEAPLFHVFNSAEVHCRSLRNSVIKRICDGQSQKQLISCKHNAFHLFCSPSDLFSIYKTTSGHCRWHCREHAAATAAYGRVGEDVAAVCTLANSWSSSSQQRKLHFHNTYRLPYCGSSPLSTCLSTSPITRKCMHRRMALFLALKRRLFSAMARAFRAALSTHPSTSTLDV